MADHKIVEPSTIQAPYPAAILEMAFDGCLEVDSKFLITGWNPGAEGLFGWARAEVVGKHVELIVSPSAATVSVRDFEMDAIFTKVKLAGRPTVTFPFTAGVVK